MQKKDRAKFIQNYLEKLYPNTPIPLSHANIFELLIAVLLSAQCTDERVNKVTPILFNKANSPEKMLELDIETIYSIVRPCGLAPQKSKAIFEFPFFNAVIASSENLNFTPCSTLWALSHHFLPKS